MSFKELRVLFRVVTFARLMNIAKLYIGFVISRIIQRSVVLGSPFAISIEPTTVCNLKCPECPTGLTILKRSGGTMSNGTFHSIVDGLSSHTFYINLYLQGEPFINPNLMNWIKQLRDKKLFTVVSTNAQLIDEKMAYAIVKSGLSKIIVGLDGLTQESYSQYRQGGSLVKVLNAISWMVEAKKQLKSMTPIVVVQFIVFEHNKGEMEQVKLLKNKGVDEVKIKTAQFMTDSPRMVAPPNDKRLSRYLPSDGKPMVAAKLYHHCWRINSSLVFSWEGIGYPCCFDKDGEFPIGAVSNKTIQDSWFSSKFNSFRNSHLKHRPHITMCQNCTEGTKWLL